MSEQLVGKLLVSKNEFLILQGNNGYVLVVMKKDAMENLIPKDMMNALKGIGDSMQSEVDKIINSVNQLSPEGKHGVYVFSKFKELAAFMEVEFNL